MSRFVERLHGRDPESCISHVHFARANAKNVLHQIEGTRIFVVIVIEILPILDRAEEI